MITLSCEFVKDLSVTQLLHVGGIVEAWYAQAMNEMKSPGQQLAAMRRRQDKPCVVCGKMIEQALGKRRYCSDSCHSKAAYRRRVERQTADSSGASKIER